MVTEQTSVNSQILRGRAWYESMGSPRLVLAPMVEGSEYAWRLLARKYGANLCYSPMLHARLFSETESYRSKAWSSMKTAKEQKLIVQFCANDPDILLSAARQVEDYADGVDVNFGCPQGIAKKGKYGAFLQDDWTLVYNLINILHKNLKLPVTAKIRIFPDREKTLEYAKMILSAGANILSVHCRTRDQKGQATGLGDWSILKYLRQNLPQETVLFANGNILYHEDIERCLQGTGFDGMMVAETHLHNPAIFMPDLYPRMDDLMGEYLNILEESNDETSFHPVKSHLFKMLKPALMKHTDIRDALSRIHTHSDKLDGCREILRMLQDRIATEHVLDTGHGYAKDHKGYLQIPWYRCQPYFRPLQPVAASQGKALLREKDNKVVTMDKEVKAADASLKRSIEAVGQLQHEGDNYANKKMLTI